MSNSGQFFFYATICHVCKACEDSEPLKRCGGCKMIAYCSAEHQKQHWPAHKKVCKSIQHLLQKNNLQSFFQEANEDTSANDWCNVRIKGIILTEILLGRKLCPDERQMFMFPRVCEVCKEFRHAQFMNCEECLCISYCSIFHQEEDFANHSLSCLSLKLCRQLDVHFVVSKDPYPAFNVVIQEEHTTLPCNIELFILNYVETSSSQKSTLDNIDSVLCSELLTCPLTFLYAMEVGNVLDRSENIVIHVVGASKLECGFPPIWETILHWLPQVNTVRVVFIGPEIEMPEQQQFNLCADCRDKHRQLKLDYHCEVFYHDYVESNLFLIPNAIIAFNCGLHENESTDNDTWLKSVPYLVKFKQTPLILTSYTKSEAEQDISRVVSSHEKRLDILSLYEKNPFASRRPYRDWASYSSSVFYHNNFISVFKSIN